MLKTVNPEAVDRLEERPLPAIGDMVLFWPRPGDVRRGRKQVPALVMWVDHDNRLLDLLVTLGMNDVMEQERVPEHVGNDRGWERKDHPSVAMVNVHQDVKELAEVRADLEGLRKIVLGDFEPPDESVLALLDTMDERLGKIEDAADRPASSVPPPMVEKPAPKEKKKRRFGRRR